MSVSLTVIAHGGGLHVFRNHLPLWRAHHADVSLVIAPENDPIPASESPWPVRLMGVAEHNGRSSIVRLRWMLNRLAGMEGITHHMIFEYDSFCMVPNPKLPLGFFGNVYRNWDPERFMAPRYVNPPWTVDHHSVVLMARAANRWLDLYEEGEADRWLSALAWLSNVPVLDHTPKGYSKSLIDERTIDSLRKAMHLGATMIHGVKDDWTLAAARQFHAEYKPNCPVLKLDTPLQQV